MPGKSGRRHVVGVAGGSGSGKSRLASELQARVGDAVCVVGHDWYYRDLSDRPMSARVEFDFDDPAALETGLLVEHLDRLLGGAAIEAPRYRFEDHCRLTATRRVEPRPWIVVEGLYVLGSEELRRCCALKVFVDAPEETRLERRIARDFSDRDRSEDSVREQWRKTVQPAHERWVQPSMAYADLVLDGREPTERLVDEVVGRLGLG